MEPNYPMHFKEHSVAEVKNHIGELGLSVSGVALRYEPEFCAGEMTSSDQKTRDRAIRLTNKAVAVCRELGGTTTTIWSAYDGFDYAFQVDYGRAWKMLIDGFREVAQAHPDMRLSIEYKPYEPRSFYFVSDIGTALLAIEDAKCDNLGVTLDFAHMLMKKENPACSLALAAERGRLYGVHLNDGYGSHDDQLMLGSVNVIQSLELVYYMQKYRYDDVIFFDSSPVREDPVKECETNIEVFNSLWKLVDELGEARISGIIANRDAVAAQKLLLLDSMLAT